jgi:hypothetical protein
MVEKFMKDRPPPPISKQQKKVKEKEKGKKERKLLNKRDAIYPVYSLK